MNLLPIKTSVTVLIGTDNKLINQIITKLYDVFNYKINYWDCPENGKHFSMLPIIAKDIKKLSQHYHQIVITYSPYLLDEFNPNDVWICHNGNVVCMGDVPDIRNLFKDFMLGELWTNFGEEKLMRGSVDVKGVTDMEKNEIIDFWTDEELKLSKEDAMNTYKILCPNIYFIRQALKLVGIE